MMTIDSVPLANNLGFLALGTYILTLCPTTLRIVFPQTKQTDIPKWLLKHRRIIGIVSFFLALGHGYILIQKRDFDFGDPKTYWIYIQGVSMFIIFTLLAVTSNDWSVKRLKKNWKRLHSLTYLSIFLLAWHIWDKMLNHWTYITPISLISIIAIAVLFLIRRRIEHQNSQQKADKKLSLPKKVREKVSV
jgi:sulfoxide reductase heme-binding subunit YedZ